MACNCINSNCNKCNHFVATLSTSISGGNLVLQIPANNYINNTEVCIAIAQAIPDGTTAAMPVVVQIGTDGTLYPLRTKCGHNIYADQVRSRRIYCTRVATDTASFIYNGRCNLPCTANIMPGSIPNIQVTTV